MPDITDDHWLNLVASSVILVRPHSFFSNPQTLNDNDFQISSSNSVTHVAKKEFQKVEEMLIKEGVKVLVFDPPDLHLPDALFPNNWLCTLPDGSLMTFPMMAPNRRLERNIAVIEFLKKNYIVKRHIKLEGFETQNIFLEGTGSLVFDHVNRFVFCALSGRSDAGLAKLIARVTNYKPIIFRSAHPITRNPIYHTNVILSVSPWLAIWVPDLIGDTVSKQNIREILKLGNRYVLEIPYEAGLGFFSANVIMLRGSKGLFLAASEKAQSILKSSLPSHFRMVSTSIPTIEKHGGGSLRCMICENFLMLKTN